MREIVLLHILYIVCAIWVFFIKGKRLYLLSLVLSLLILINFYFNRDFLNEIFFFMTIIWVTALFVRSGKVFLEGYKKSLKEKLGDKVSLCNSLENENKVLESKKRVLDEKTLKIGSMYETLKSMSGMLRTSEIVTSFFMFINDNIVYSKCYVALFEKGNKEKISRELYCMKKKDIAPKRKNLDEDELMMRILGNAKTLRAKKTITSSDSGWKNLVFNGTAKKLDIIPLIVEKEVIAFVVIIDLQKEQEQEFSMFISQVSMELKKASLYEHVEELSFTDGLTEIYLRRYFTERAQEEISRAKRLKQNFSVLMLDIDHFKKCNDQYGHMVGDVVLRETAEVIKENIREIDLVARYGGEEFTVLLPDSDLDSAEHVAERVRKNLESREIIAYDETLNITISIGISVYPDNGNTLDEIVNKADQALYASKANGRNRVTVYSGE